MKKQTETRNAEDKVRLRKKMKELRNRLDADEVKSLSEQICRNITNLPVYQKADVILSYFATGNEVSLITLMEAAVAEGKEVYLPKVRGREMDFFRYRTMEDVAPGYMGIYEPAATEMFQGKNQIEDMNTIILMPGLAFDHKKNRIGYGGGFYDRYLEDYEIYRIGVCYDFQITEEKIPYNMFDIKPDMIVTERQIMN